MLLSSNRLSSLSRAVVASAVLASALGLLTAVATPAHAASVFYIRFSGVLGESTGQGHINWMDVERYGISVDIEPPVGQGRGSASIDAMTFTKQLDRGSPYLFQAALTGRLYAAVTFDVIDADFGRIEARWVLGSAFFTDYETVGTIEQPGSPLETFSLQAETYAYTHYPYGPAGNALTPIRVAWNVAANPAVVSNRIARVARLSQGAGIYAPSIAAPATSPSAVSPAAVPTPAAAPLGLALLAAVVGRRRALILYPPTPNRHASPPRPPAAPSRHGYSVGVLAPRDRPLE